MSQYLQIIEREVAQYRPDWVIVLIVHNDFDESYRFKAGRYTSSFLKLRVALEVDDPALLPKLKALEPRIIDNFQIYLRDLRRDAVIEYS